VVAFALLFPFWITVAVASTSLAAGAVRAAEHRVRAAVIVLPVIIIIIIIIAAGVAYLAANHSSHRAQAKSALSRTAHPKMAFGWLWDSVSARA
jgi:flagellar basal body-associated protein FliL